MIKMKIAWIGMFIISAATVSCQNQDSSTQKQKEMNFKINKSENDWKRELSDDQYFILRQKGTEHPHTGEYNLHFKDGVYHCAGCGNPLFKSDNKFESNCGWPSFDSAMNDSTVVEVPDNTHGMRRTEILCANCGGHLGHVFPDGPTETGMRYCINSGALGFEEEEKE